MRPDETTKWHFYVHSALDVIDEKVAQALANEKAINDRRIANNEPRLSGNELPVLGLLIPLDEYRLYGHASNTKIKFIIAIRDVYLNSS